MESQRSPAIVIGVLVALLATGPAMSRSVDPPTATEAGSSLSVVTLDPYRGGLRTIDVETDEEPLPFLFDTGGGITIITPEFAEKIGCEPHGEMMGLRMTGQRVRFQQCEDVGLRIGGETIRYRRIAVMEVNEMLPDGWPSVGGLVSLQTFRDRPVTIDLARDRLVLETADSLRRRVVSMRSVHVKVNRGDRDDGITMAVAVQLPGGLAWLDFDCGNLDRILLDVGVARAMGLDLPDPGFGGGFSTEGDGRRWNFDDVEIDPVGLEPQRLPVGVKRLVYDGALNADFFERWVFTVDLPSERLWATPAETFTLQVSEETAPGPS